jgi:hypothetical protein
MGPLYDGWDERQSTGRRLRAVVESVREALGAEGSHPMHLMRARRVIVSHAVKMRSPWGARPILFTDFDGVLHPLSALEGFRMRLPREEAIRRGRMFRWAGLLEDALGATGDVPGSGVTP